MAEGSIELPVSMEAEVSVIAAILIGGREAMKKMQHIVTKDDFTDRRHVIIWRAATYLMKRDKEIDLLTLSDFLKQKLLLDEVGGSAYLTETTNYIPTYMNCHLYAKIVADKAVARRIILAAQDIIKKATGEDDMDNFVYEAEQRLKGVTRSSARKESKHSVVDLEEWRKIARETTPPTGGIRGMSLGYRKLDEMTEGFEPGEVMILTGHTKHGKSKLAANLAWNVAQQGKNVMFINTEMTKMQVARRMNGMAKDDSPTKGKIYMNDRADLEAYDVTALMERAKEMGCDMVIVDHLHFFSRSTDNQTNEISKITKEFKEAAVQYELPLLLLCHIKQGDTTKRPTLESLKGSSSIAQDADIILTVWRDDRPTATDPFKTEVLRLAHRSAERAITHIELFGEGIRLLEERPPTTEQQKQWVEDNAKMLGENDDDDEEPAW
jgi:replicative DNA helicase